SFERRSASRRRRELRTAPANGRGSDARTVVPAFGASSDEGDAAATEGPAFLPDDRPHGSPPRSIDDLAPNDRLARALLTARHGKCKTSPSQAQETFSCPA